MTSSLDKLDAMYVLEMWRQKARNSKQDTSPWSLYFIRSVEKRHDLLSWFVSFTASSLRVKKQGIDNVILCRLLMHTPGSFSVACFKTIVKATKTADKGQHHFKPTRTQSRNKYTVWGVEKREWVTHFQSHIFERKTQWNAELLPY